MSLLDVAVIGFMSFIALTAVGLRSRPSCMDGPLPARDFEKARWSLAVMYPASVAIR
jgi:hypothetical protein